LDYYNLNQDVCLASIESLKEGFLETQKELLKRLNSDLEDIAKKKHEEYLRELEEVIVSLSSCSRENLRVFFSLLMSFAHF
jgi:hypothetical protein